MRPGANPLGRSIGTAHRLVRAWGDRELAPLGATVTDWVLLGHLRDAAAPGPSQTELARYAGMGGPALVRHLDRLEADGVVARCRDAADRRIMRVTLTAQGRSWLAEIAEVVDGCDARLRAELSGREQQLLERSLEKVSLFARAQLDQGGAPWT